MTRPAPHRPRRPETGTDLKQVIAAPVIWAAHFLTAYVFAAVWCEKLGRETPILGARIAVLAATVLALVAIGILARRLWRAHAPSLTDADFDFEYNAPEERHRFLAHVGLMLCALSAVAVLYGTLPALTLSSCR